ncbi:MAG: glutamate-cysteine ligase family protein [Myxococcota bacterium]|nr:glutamate-cysteine ligase family protein [Myxococcota bacterium]
MTDQTESTLVNRLASLCRKQWQQEPVIKFKSISEFPLVRLDGRSVDVAMLWAYLKKGMIQVREPNGMLSGLKGQNHSFKAGFGRTTVQIHSASHRNLCGLWGQQTALINQILETAKPKNLSLLSFGRQPNAIPSQEQLTQKFEYFSVLKNMQDAWVPFSTVAHERFRVYVPSESRISVLNLFQWLWPVFVAMFGNDHIMGGKDHYQNHLFLRQVLKSKSEYFPITIPARIRTLEQWIKHTAGCIMLTAKDQDGWAIAHQNTFQSWADTVAPDDDTLWDHWVTHLKYTFEPAQLTNDGAIEVRYVAQQLQEIRHAFHALCLGIAHAHEEIWTFLYAFSPDESRLDVRGLRMHEIVDQALNHERDPSLALNRHLDKAIRYGLNAPEAFTGFIEGIMRYAEDALSVHEPDAVQSLNPIWTRLNVKKSPPQTLRSDFAIRGMSTVMEKYLL